MKNILFTGFLFLLITSCQSDKVSFNNEKLSSAYTSYIADESIDNAKKFAGSVVEYTMENPDGQELENALIVGIDVSKKHKLLRTEASFLTTLLKNFPNNPNHADYVYELANKMDTLRKPEAANALYYSFAEKYRKDPRVEKAKAKMNKGISDIDTYLTSLGQEIFDNPDESGINRSKAQAYVDACEAYAIVNPESVAAPEFLYKAAEIARTLKNNAKVLSIYDWIIEKYPDYENTPTCLFLKGFILENNLNNIEEAKKTYQLFLQKYPNHKLSKDVTFLLENIGKSDEEIMKILAQKKK